MKAEESYFAQAEFPRTPADIDASDSAASAPVCLGAISKVSIVMVWLWALFETHWELAGETEILAIVAVLVAKLILTAIVIGTLRRVHFALAVFSFCCVVSIVVIALALPRMYSLSPWFFCLSLVETVLKTAVVVSLAFDYFGSDATAEETEQTWRMR
ncbi:hypothetical protein LMG27952_02859 [Paraburkholderia hiiakae]|uniref:Transmembrane protein n=2 Tax=Paraburkholderia hiiakae TaxID=1081782 RepID=A0ABM8NMX5_9BURK|nr:hypothetical protein LMG27952_02859 [Paraburkholderia hiiakae]